MYKKHRYTGEMPNNGSANDLNREYIYVRRLISVLTNDDSDKLIVEKLKGKNLSSLLYNAKIIDNSKNMTANKKILACVIRAIEREKHLCRKRELEQSWGRKFLNSFNCLYPVMKDGDNGEQMQDQKSCQKGIKRQTHSRRTRTSSTRTPKTACRSSFKNKCVSSVRCTKTATTELEKQSKHASYVDSFRKSTYSCIESVLTDKEKDDDLISECWKAPQQVPISCVCLLENLMYESVSPVELCQRKLSCAIVYPGKPFPIVRSVDRAEKKCSSTQTSESSYEPEANVPNNIKLQDLLEAASNLINTRDQREYVRSFLTNFEPPFDLSAGFPPYLKLPMKKSEDLVGKESVYGSHSNLSLPSDCLSVFHHPRMTTTANDDVYQKMDSWKQVRDNDPWQDTAESIISGVINESLPHDRADYSQLGACILKRLGAYPVSTTFKDTRHHKHNLNIPEIILQCTEFFESDNGETEKSPEPSKQNGTQQVKDLKLHESPSIVEMKLLNEMNKPKPWDGRRMENYCFVDSGNAGSQKVDLLNLSESSLVDIGTFETKTGQADASKDRKNFQSREPLKTTPSGLEQGGRKPKRGAVERKQERSRIPEIRRVSPVPQLIENKEPKTVKPVRPKAFPEISHETKDPPDASALIENISIIHETPEPDVRTDLSEIPPSAVITETETPPPEPAQRWEPVEADVETFDGVGEGQKTLTDSPANKPDKKNPCKKSRNFKEKINSKKKCKAAKKKTHSEKNDSGNCRVM